MADVTFIFHSDWLDSIKHLSVEQQDKVIAEIVRYGTEREPEHTDDPIVQMAVNFLRGGIDFSKNKYAEKVQGGKNSSRKKYSEDRIYEIAREHPDWNSAKMAEFMGCSKSTIDHSEGWKHRFVDDWLCAADE